MANLAALEEARFDQFADNEDIREASVESFVMPGKYTILFKGLTAKYNPTEKQDGTPLPEQFAPGAPVLVGIGVIDGTDVRLRNVKFCLTPQQGYKPYLIWANALKAMGKNAPQNQQELEEIVEYLEVIGLRWKVGLIMKRGDEPIVFANDQEKANSYVRDGYTPVNYLDKNPGSVTVVKD